MQEALWSESAWHGVAGTVGLRHGSYFPRFLEPRWRAEPALLNVIQMRHPVFGGPLVYGAAAT
jgi:hypothetical protein